MKHLYMCKALLSTRNALEGDLLSELQKETF